MRLPSLAIRIADAEDQELPEEKIGRLQLRGAVVTPGYVANAVANEAAFTADGWLNTGDTGFFTDGTMHVIQHMVEAAEKGCARDRSGGQRRSLVLSSGMTRK